MSPVSSSLWAGKKNNSTILKIIPSVIDMNTIGKELEVNKVIMDEGIQDEEQWAQNVEVFQEKRFSRRPGLEDLVVVQIFSCFKGYLVCTKLIPILWSQLFWGSLGKERGYVWTVRMELDNKR
jgi:hypothetical protein